MPGRKNAEEIRVVRRLEKKSESSKARAAGCDGCGKEDGRHRSER